MAADYTPPIVLASSSPRRRQLLGLLVEEFVVVPPEVEEGAARVPADLLALAERKAGAAAARFPQSLVIAADTVVFRDERPLGKPKDLAEARDFLHALSGGWHSVFTGLVVQKGKHVRKSLVETRVLFRALTEEEVEWYLKSGEALDKAGAYGIQGRAAAFVERIEGDFYNVVGLPLCVLWGILWEMGWRPKES